MRFIKNGELQDEKIAFALRTASRDFANGEIAEVRDLLLEIIAAIDEFESLQKQ